MRIATLSSILLLAAGCATTQIPLTTPPMPDDLSTRDDPATWSAPVVAPPAPVPAPEDAPHTAEERLPLFEDGKEYRLAVAPGWPLTIVLEPGEQITSIVGGDRPVLLEQEQPPWDVKHSPQNTPRQHVFVTVTKPGLSMGLVVATDRRTYSLTLKSVGKTATRYARWRYAPKPVTAQPTPPPGPLPHPPFRLHIGYWMSQHGASPEWVPSVYDDGQKMYLLFPVTVLYQEAPLVRGVGVNGPYLLNSRQIGRVVIVDQLAPRLELRIGIGEHAQVVQIVRGMLDTIDCPGHAQCPQW
jgi:type IV secretion system protein VirB9